MNRTLGDSFIRKTMDESGVKGDVYDLRKQLEIVHKQNH